MRLTWFIARKEVAHGLNGYYLYLLVGLFAIAYAVPVFWSQGGSNVFLTGLVDLKPLFNTLPLFLAVLVPALTMRAWTAELGSGTLELLLTWPLSERQLVVGKFWGHFLQLLMSLLAILPLPILVGRLGELDWGPVWGALLGALLLGGCCVAICLFVGCFGRDPIRSFLLGLVVLAASMILPWPSLNLQMRFVNLARGVVDLSDLLFYLVLTGFFLMLSLVVVRGRRQLSGLWRTRLPFYAKSLGLPVVVLVLGLWYLERPLARWDLTADKLYSLNDASLALLDALPEPVTFEVYFSGEVPARLQGVVDLVTSHLEEYRVQGKGKVIVTYIDPDVDPAGAERATSLGISKTRANLYSKNGVQAVELWFGLAVCYGADHEVFPSVQSVENLEYDLGAALFRLTRARKPRILLVGPTYAEGRGVVFDINADLKAVSDELGRFFEVRQVPLNADTVLHLNEADAVFVWSLSHFTETQLYDFDQYLVAGGSALILASGLKVDPNLLLAQAVPHSRADDFYAHLGFEVHRDLVCDQNCTKVKYTEVHPPVLKPYPLFLQLSGQSGGLDPSDEATAQLHRLVVPWASSLQLTDQAAGVRAIAKTSDQAWLQTSDYVLDPGGLPGPTSFDQYLLGLAITGRLTSFFAQAPDGKSSEGFLAKGSADANVLVWSSEHLLTQTRDSAALVWALRSASYLTTRTALAGIDRRSNALRPARVLTPAEADQFRWLSVLPIPLLLLIFALARGWWRRRSISVLKRGEA